MKYSEFGKTGLKVPAIVFGTSALGNLYTALDYKIKLNIVEECFKNVSIPVFDSAGKYGAGLALEMLGKCLSDLNIAPNKVLISNKLGWLRTQLKTAEPTFEPGVWKNLKNDAVQKISYQGILECFEQGNELLNGYTPQLVSVHDPDEYILSGETDKEKEKLFNDILDAYSALAELKTKGKVKAIGIGAKNWKIIQKVAQFIELDWVMFANSFTIMNHPEDLLEFILELHAKKTGIINSAVFHSGFLTGSDYFDYVLIKPDTPQNIVKFKWRESFFDICNKFSVKPSVACVNFGLTPPGVVGISLNTSNPKRVKDNVDSVTEIIPADFYAEMISNNLIRKDYTYIQSFLK